MAQIPAPTTPRIEVYDDVDQLLSEETSRLSLFKGRHSVILALTCPLQRVILLPGHKYCPDCAGTCINGTAECATCGAKGQVALPPSNENESRELEALQKILKQLDDDLLLGRKFGPPMRKHKNIKGPGPIAPSLKVYLQAATPADPPAEN